MQVVIDIPEDVKAVIDRNGTNEIVAETLWQAVKNGTPLSKIVDNLKELSKDHRHNYSSNSHVERAWRLGIEDSIDLILVESEDEE